MRLKNIISDRRTLTTTDAATTGIACLEGDETGTVATKGSGQPYNIAEFESCFATVIGYPMPLEADLIGLQSKTIQLANDRATEVSADGSLQLDTDEIDATLESGGSAPVERLGGVPISSTQAFENCTNTRTAITPVRA